jgi:hypothetical protein
VLVVVTALIGGMIGALLVAVPTAAAAHRAPAARGLLLAAMSLGGIADALANGRRRWRTAVTRRLSLLLSALAAVSTLMIPASALRVLASLLFAAGLALNPALTTVSLLVDRHVGAASAAEAFGWLAAGISVGMGAASAIAGQVTDPSRPGTAFAVAAVSGGSRQYWCCAPHSCSAAGGRSVLVVRNRALDAEIPAAPPGRGSWAQRGRRRWRQLPAVRSDVEARAHDRRERPDRTGDRGFV